MLTMFRKCGSMVPPALRPGWFALPLLAALSGALEAGTAGMVYLLVQVLQEPQSIFELPIVRHMGWLFAGQADSTIVLRFAALIGAYHLIKNLIAVIIQYFHQWVHARTHAELSNSLLRGYLLLPYPFHFRRHSADLIRNTTGSVGAVVGALAAGNALLLELLVGGGLLVVLLTAAPRVTVISGIALTLVVVGVLRLTRRLALRSGQEAHALGQDLQQTVQNALGGIKEIKALGREKHFFDAFSDVQRRKVELGHLGVTLGVVPKLLIETAFVMAALVVVVLVTLQPVSGAEALPTVGLFAYAGFRLIPMTNRLVVQLNALRASAPAVDSIYDDMLLIRHEVAPEWEEAGGALALGSELRVEGVSYTYPGAVRPAISDVNLVLPSGGSLGIVGPTGAGKSTLVDLVVGLLTPTEGRILSDGVDLKGRHRRWRQRIGYVPQSIFLLDDTLRRNIAMGIADERIDDDAVEAAIRMARFEGVVASLPEGLDTPLGERGIRLSGGERQRVGIARALYHDPDLLVFDEATSALDNVTEAEVNRAVESLRGRKSMLVIAHRLSTVRRCDRLLYLEDGRIVAEGSYDDLLASDPRFRRMAGAPEAPTRDGG